MHPSKLFRYRPNSYFYYLEQVRYVEPVTRNGQQNNCSKKLFLVNYQWSNLFSYSNKHLFTCSKSTIKTLGKGKKYISFFYLGFLSLDVHDSQDTNGRGRPILTLCLYHFNPLHEHFGLSLAITAEGSAHLIVSERTLTRNIWFPSASR